MNVRLWAAVVALALVAGLFAWTRDTAAAHSNGTGNGTVRAPQSTSTPAAPLPVVVQGRVTAVRGTTATLATPDRPVCPAPATPTAGAVRCNAIIAGAIYQVDTAHAAYESAAGTPLQGQGAQARLAVGDSVVVVGSRQSGNTGGTTLLRATVIQRGAGCAGR